MSLPTLNPYLDVVRYVRYAIHMGQINYKIPDPLHKALRVRAAEEGLTIKELLIRLLAEALGLKEQ